MAQSGNKAASVPVRSMTGYGRATAPDGRVTAEIRSVNGRYFKLNFKTWGRYASLEDRVKTMLAERGIKRGSVDVNLNFETAKSTSTDALDAEALAAYSKQAHRAVKKLKLKGGVQLQSLLLLPGVVKRAEGAGDEDQVWPECKVALDAAIDAFTAMREKEGAAIAQDVRDNLARLVTQREEIQAAAPESLKVLVQRFKDRVQKLLQDSGVNAPLNNDVLEREIVMASDRTDVSEELARLESHFKQVEATLNGGGETGKKLDFLTQELFRETNTIGSKTSDEKITYRVVEMKGTIEKIREQVQNLE